MKLKPSAIKRTIFKMTLLVATVFLSFGCAHKPTKTYTAEQVNVLFLQHALKAPIVIDDKTIILDARRPFDFAMAHYPSAHNVDWTLFADTTGPFPGRLKTNLSEEIRSLSLLGIDLQSKVVVVGYGLNGKGEEARLAWTLFYLGIENVQVSDVDSLGLRFSNVEAPAKPNAKRWEPKLNKGVVTTKNEVIQAATSRLDEGLKGGPKNKNLKRFVPIKPVIRTHIIDVRTNKEFFTKTRKSRYVLPDLRAFNIDWKEFFTSQGRPNLAIVKQLEAIGIKTSDRILVISNNGVRSGAATFALLSLGYGRAANFAGGYVELLAE